MWGKVGKLSQNGHFQSFLSKIWLKTRLHKPAAIETKQNLDHQLCQFFTSPRLS